MTTTSTKTATNAGTPVPELAQKVTDTFLSTLKQSQDLTVRAAEAWTKAASALPTPDLSNEAGRPSTADLSAITTYGFDLAASVLQSQRDFSIKLLSAFASPTTA